MILDNFIVEFSEHVSVVVDKFEELSSYSPEIILANGQTWGNLKIEKYSFLLKINISGLAAQRTTLTLSLYITESYLLNWSE